MNTYITSFEIINILGIDTDIKCICIENVSNLGSWVKGISIISTDVGNADIIYIIICFKI